MLAFSEVISSKDSMMTGDLASYFRTSRQGLDCILAGLKAADREPGTIKSVLDFGSGYGRVYRAMAVSFPDAELTASDLIADAAQFCAETFGGDWVQSTEDLAFSLPRKYDLIWLGSVFTHLPAYRWCRLLDFLNQSLNPEGIVVFTSHGATALHYFEHGLMAANPNICPAGRFAAMKACLHLIGFDFIPNQPYAMKHHRTVEGAALTDGEYGFSFATQWWVSDLINRMPGWELVFYAAPGWGNNHDGITIRKTGA